MRRMASQPRQIDSGEEWDGEREPEGEGPVGEDIVDGGRQREVKGAGGSGVRVGVRLVEASMAGARLLPRRVIRGNA